MGSGIAPQIKQAFPEAWEADRRTNPGLESKLGCVSKAYHKLENGKDLLVVNSYTQYAYGGPKGTVHANYGAIRSCFQKIKKLAEMELDYIAGDVVRVGFPKIGAGLAKGDWSIISTIINEELDCDFIFPILVEYDLSKNKAD
jgi:O-acetyl-ADP-ribose deacetylase (regulator of RNase III)